MSDRQHPLDPHGQKSATSRVGSEKADRGEFQQDVDDSQPTTERDLRPQKAQSGTKE